LTTGSHDVIAQEEPVTQEHDDGEDPRAFWEDLYASRDSVWSGRPNAALESVAAELDPGRALDLGCGEGGDAVWLAQRGWHVTAIDVAPTALERGRAAAEQIGVADRIEWVAVDLAESMPPGPFDLVSAMFLQSPIAFARDGVLRRAAAVVAPGGSLVVVSHATMPPWSKHRHDDAPSLPTPEETVASLALPGDAWDVVVSEVREREATGPDGEVATLDDAVVVARRS
jgi:SAM-dependent methyltransferase